MKKKFQAKEVLDFLYNPLNERNCENSPYNEDHDDFQHRLPCGHKTAGLAFIVIPIRI